MWTFADYDTVTQSAILEADGLLRIPKRLRKAQALTSSTIDFGPASKCCQPTRWTDDNWTVCRTIPPFALHRSEVHTCQASALPLS